MFETIVSLFVLLVVPCAAQQDISTRIDQYIKAEMLRQQIPGLSLAVVRNGKIALVKSYGFSNVEHQIPVKPETGQFYSDFLAERVFRPLGMITARVISEADIVPNRAAGYRLVDGKLKNQEWVSPSTNTTADGSLYFTILDLAKWDAALYTNKPLMQWHG